MKKLTDQGNSYINKFRENQEEQEKYIEDKSYFLKKMVVPKEFAIEIQDLESKLSAEYRQTIDNIVSDFELTSEGNVEFLLKAQKKGYIRLEPTYGKLSIITGYYLILSEQATKDLINGNLVVGAIVGLIAAIDPELISKATAAIIGAAIMLNVAIIRLMDAGDGVYYYINPFLFSTIPVLGPAALLASWVGPLRN